MLSHLRPALVLLLALTVLTGLIYPLAVTGIAQVAFPWTANGSLITREDHSVVGSALIGQNFTRPEYFQSRPSLAGTAGYDAGASAASNLGPTSKTLVETITARIEALKAANPNAVGPIPGDLVTASASGLDPHISPAAALWQVPRVARARGMEEDALRQMVAQLTEGAGWPLFGAARVNVLTLNMALDRVRAGGGG